MRHPAFLLLPAVAALAMLAIPATPVPAHGASDDSRQTLTCASEKRQYQRCYAYNWKDAELVEQFSNTACVRGENWDQDGDWLWVSDGCRASFAEVVLPPPPVRGANAEETVSCASNDRKFQRCEVGRWRDAKLVRQDSRADCVRGETWDLDATSLWVKDGCRGTFAEAGRGRGRPPRGGHGPGGSSPEPSAPATPWDREIRFGCESSDQKYRFCTVDVGRKGWVELEKRESKAECVQDRSWGWNRAGVWVDKGCRAKFVVHRRG